MLACSYHDDRPAVGICVRCRRAICTACCTRLDGVNHCHQCLKNLGRLSGELRRPAPPGAAVAVLVLLVGCFFLFLECLFLVEGKLAP